MERFSKASLRDVLKRRIVQIERQWRFDPDNGWAQVEGKGEDANRAYGEYDAYRSLIDTFNLEECA